MIVTNSLSGGGAERSMNLLSTELTERGWHVSLIPINASRIDQIVPTCEVFPLNRKWNDGLKSTVLALKNLNRIARLWRPDIVALNCDLPELFGACLLGNYNLIAIEHSSNPWSQRPNLGKMVRKILTFRKVTWVAVANHLCIWPTRNLPSKVLQNPLTPAGEVRTQEPHSSIKRLVYIGRLSSEKRPKIALDLALSESMEVVMIGDGILREQLENQARRDLINAIFLGHVDNPWLEIQSGDLLIVPSAFEGDGLVVLEGLQQNVPMLLADIPDLRRLRLPEKNYCTNPYDFSLRIKDFAENLEGLKVPSSQSEKLVRERNLEVIGTEWETFLEKLT